MWEQMLEYFRNNPIYFYIAVALVAAILLVIIIAIAVGVKRSKKRKAAARAAKSEAAPAAVQPKETARCPTTGSHTHISTVRKCRNRRKRG